MIGYRSSFRLLAEIGIADPAALAGQSPLPVETAEAAQAAQDAAMVAPPRRKPRPVFGGLRSAIFE